MEEKKFDWDNWYCCIATMGVITAPASALTIIRNRSYLKGLNMMDSLPKEVAKILEKNRKFMEKLEVVIEGDKLITKLQAEKIYERAKGISAKLLAVKELTKETKSLIKRDTLQLKKILKTKTKGLK